MVLVTGTDRAADVVPFEAIAKAAQGPSLDQPVQVPLQVAAGFTGERVAGVASLEPGERAWRFSPLSAWRPGPYRIHIHPDLEEAAGNTVCVPFEHLSRGSRSCAKLLLSFDSTGTPQ